MAGDNTKTLVRMANQIGTFFEPYSEEEAVAGVQLHIEKFWSPAMRRDLVAYMDHGGEGLLPSVTKAFQRFTDPDDSPAERAILAPGNSGQMASDAG
ncbi:formate dehydrogenase subunit delta [Terrihabitans rhizophilus]|uniref:Formate dehydrogenase subunit delta n=1 Tax=Terrihabitans rhizophilus TaxID=3092662 RepID=A0ABU4RLV5_9HYPH|nr:formate dehydrogenase subunit delta [Terrihabitans sp. PJ23]MDX6805787.1 formate dehydrogenase subunit delta [Terrihabitans sp. PJ23]